MVELGILADLPASNQLSLFDFRVPDSKKQEKDNRWEE